MSPREVNQEWKRRKGEKVGEEEELRSQWVFVLIGFREGANGVES
jgi:hypothetical protein